MYFLSLWICLFYVFHIIIQYVAFCVRPPSFSITFSRSSLLSHVSVQHSFLLWNKWYSIMCINHMDNILQLMDASLVSCFLLLWITLLWRVVHKVLFGRSSVGSFLLSADFLPLSSTELNASGQLPWFLSLVDSETFEILPRAHLSN